jgi:hypothetical protein
MFQRITASGDCRLKNFMNHLFLFKQNIDGQLTPKELAVSASGLRAR